MNIVISSSASLQKDIATYRSKFETAGHQVLAYPVVIEGALLEEYPHVYREFYKHIVNADLLFVLNGEKNGVAGYIGPSVFAEIAFAIGINQVYGKNIQIQILNPFGEHSPYREELLLWEDLGWLKVGHWDE